MDLGEGLGSVLAEPVVAHGRAGVWTAGEAGEQESGNVAVGSVEVGGDHLRSRDWRCGEQAQLAGFAGRGVVGVVDVPAETRPAPQHHALQIDDGNQVIAVPPAQRKPGNGVDPPARTDRAGDPSDGLSASWSGIVVSCPRQR
jgi:hypothetical protein